MTDTTYNVMKPDKGVPIKAWTKACPAQGHCASAATYHVVLCERYPGVWHPLSAGRHFDVENLRISEVGCLSQTL